MSIPYRYLLSPLILFGALSRLVPLDSAQLAGLATTACDGIIRNRCRAIAARPSTCGRSARVDSDLTGTGWDGRGWSRTCGVLLAAMDAVFESGLVQVWHELADE